MKSSIPWRVSFALAAAFILVGGPQHPGGDMAQMLADPRWIPSHLLVLAGFVALLVGLVLLRREAFPPATGRWLRLAVIGTALQTVEMVFHTASVVDLAAYTAGRATPILSTHLVLTFVIYPVFGVTMAGLIWSGMRERALGSRWIGWMGIAGAIAHGAAPLLVLGLELSWARILFPMVMLLAFWLLITALVPARAAEADRAVARAA